MPIIKDKITRWEIIYRELEKSYNYECYITQFDILKIINREVNIENQISKSSLEKDLQYLKKNLGLKIMAGGNKGIQLSKLINFDETLANHLGFAPVKDTDYKHLYMEALRKLNTLTNEQLTKFIQDEKFTSTQIP